MTMITHGNSTVILLVIVVLTLCFSSTHSFGVSSKRPTKNALPTLDKTTEKYVPPPSVNAGQFYGPLTTMIKCGPVPVAKRIFGSSEYEQSVWRYMAESKEADIRQAQGNMDGYWASPELWVEQKMLEQSGKRAVFDYGQEPTLEKIILAGVWGALSSGIILRATWQLIHGNRNLF